MPGAIQTSAPINPDNSGGALVDTSGYVIGITTLAVASPQGNAKAHCIGFAIPSNLARDIARQIIASGHVSNSHRAALGVQVTTVTGAGGAPAGVGIVAVTSTGPADRARLHPGDVIRSSGHTQMPGAATLSQVLASAPRTARHPRGRPRRQRPDRGGDARRADRRLAQIAVVLRHGAFGVVEFAFEDAQAGVGQVTSVAPAQQSARCASITSPRAWSAAA